jgi:hypothetical protein
LKIEKEETKMNSPLQKRKKEEQMIRDEVIGLRNAEGVTRIEISFDRVATWTLVFTNVFFVSYFFGKLFQWV